MRQGAKLRVAFLRAFIGAVRLHDSAAADELIRRYKLPPEVESLAEVALPVDVVAALTAEAAARVGDPFLGLHLASMVPRGRYGLFEFLLRNGTTIGHAGTLAERYCRLVDDLTEVTMRDEGNEVRLDLRIPGSPQCAGRQANEFTVVLVVRMLREGLHDAWSPHRIWFAHPTPEDPSPLISFFGTEQITFDRGSNGFSILDADRARPIISADDALRTVLERHVDGILGTIPAPRDHSVEVLCDRIRRALPEGEVRLERIAATLGVGPRTLQRRITEIGVTFRTLVERVRAEASKRYLGDETLPLGEIAFLLGYSDVRAFVRAFKRWNGATPSAYRKRQADNKQAHLVVTKPRG